MGSGFRVRGSGFVLVQGSGFRVLDGFRFRVLVPSVRTWTRTNLKP